MIDSTPSSVIVEYLKALASGDLERAADLPDHDFTFQGPGMEAALGREAFLSQLGWKYEHARGVRLLHQVEQDDAVASLYELDAETPHGATTFLMTEWNTVRAGRVRSSLLVFDTAPGARLHPAEHASAA